MQILLAGSDLNYNLEYYVFSALKQLGHNVEFFSFYESGLNHQFRDPIRILSSRSREMRLLLKPIVLSKLNRQFRSLVERLVPDGIIVVKGELLFPETMVWAKKQSGAQTALWYPDDPRFFNSLVQYIAPSYDHIFSVSPYFLDKYRSLGITNVHFLPVGCDPEVHQRMELSDVERKVLHSDVCFVGTYLPKRAKLLRQLKGYKVVINGNYWKPFSRLPNTGPPVYGPNMIKMFSAAAIVLNIHHQGDIEWGKINMRTFEATAAGSFVLTDQPPGLEEFFKPSEEVACYDNDHDVPKLVESYLADENARERIATRGQLRACKDHTYVSRVKKLLSCLS